MQVYLHKTVLSADSLLKKIFRRVSFLIEEGEQLEIPSSSLQYFLEKKPTAKKVITNEVMEQYLSLDDHDVMICLKTWVNCQDPILADLTSRFLNRSLFRTTFIQKKGIKNLKENILRETKKYLKKAGLPYDDFSAGFYIDFDKSYSEAYKYENESIWILDDDQKAIEFSKAADTKHIIALTQPVVKPYVVHPKEINLDWH
jgi:HD superfamily phosphohydrolase